VKIDWSECLLNLLPGFDIIFLDCWRPKNPDQIVNIFDCFKSAFDWRWVCLLDFYEYINRKIGWL